MEFLEQDYPELDTRQQRLDMCYAKAAFYQQQLDAFVGNIQEKDELGTALVAELDAIFPMFDEIVWLHGQALVPLADENGDISGEGFTSTDGYGKHKGFDTVMWEDDGMVKMKIMHRILVGEEVEAPFKTVVRQEKYYKYFDLDAAVFSVDELEEALLTGQGGPIEKHDNICDVVEGESRQLVSMLRSTKFRRLSHRQQVKLVDNFVVQAEDKARIRDLQIIAEPLYAYAPLLGKAAVRRFVPIDLSEVVIKGVCVGLDALVTTELRQQPIRRNQDNSFLYDGLCIVVDPDEDTRTGLGLAQAQVLYVPTQTQTFDAALYTEE
jgi:hypothetical protein